VGAVLIGTSIFVPRSFNRPNEEQLAEYLNDPWIFMRKATFAARQIWKSQEGALRTMREVHDKKARWLSVALWLLILGSMLIVAAALTTI